MVMGSQLVILVLVCVAASSHAQIFKSNAEVTSCGPATHDEAMHAYTDAKTNLTACCVESGLPDFPPSLMVTTSSRLLHDRKKMELKATCCFPMGSKCKPFDAKKQKIYCCDSGICTSGSCVPFKPTLQINVTLAQDACVDKTRPHHAMLSIKPINKKKGQKTFTGDACCVSPAIHVVPFRDNCCSTSFAPCSPGRFVTEGRNALAVPCCGNRTDQLKVSFCSVTLIPTGHSVLKQFSEVSGRDVRFCEAPQAGKYNVTTDLDASRTNLGIKNDAVLHLNQSVCCKGTKRIVLGATGCCENPDFFFTQLSTELEKCCTQQCNQRAVCCYGHCTDKTEKCSDDSGKALPLEEAPCPS